MFVKRPANEVLCTGEEFPPRKILELNQVQVQDPEPEIYRQTANQEPGGAGGAGNPVQVQW